MLREDGGGQASSVKGSCRTPSEQLVRSTLWLLQLPATLRQHRQLSQSVSGELKHVPPLAS